MKPNLLLVIIFFLSPYLNVSLAQDVVSTSGEFFESQQMQISWTLGEPVIETCIGAGYYLTQGFQQSFLFITPIRSLPFTTAKIIAYPNPANSIVNLSITGNEIEHWSYLLYNSDGKLLLNKKAESEISQISLVDYATSNYVLKVIRNGREMKAFKIVKIE